MVRDEFLTKLATFGSNIETLEEVIDSTSAYIKSYEQKASMGEYKRKEYEKIARSYRELLKEYKRELKKMKDAQNEIMQILQKYPEADIGGKCRRCGSLHHMDKEIIFEKDYYVKIFDGLGRKFYDGKKLVIWKCLRCGALMFYCINLEF